MAAWGGTTQLVPVFPAGDAMVEPFWPQGLGSNRGFHSALDAAHALRVLAEEGLHPALLDRQFSFDVMVHIGGAFPPSRSSTRPASSQCFSAACVEVRSI